jgi:cytochrome P450 family 135
MEKCQRRYGDIFTLRILHAGTSVLLCDPEDVKRVFTASPDSLGVSVANTLLGLVLGPRSVMLLEEPEHMARRKLVLPSFHGRQMEGDRDMIGEVAREEVRRWPSERPLELWPRMQAITLRVIMRAVFGGRDTGHLVCLRERLERLTAWMNDPRTLARLAALGPRSIARSRSFRAAMAPVEAGVLEEVRRRRARPADAPGGIVSILAQARYEDGSPISESDLRDELMTLLTDGPTSTSLAWVFERLLRHPHKLERLREELDAQAGGGDYLDAVVNETLRLCPPVATVARRLLAPMRVGGYLLPAGTDVAPCVHLIHRRHDVYPQPRSFLPERFLQRPPGTYTWIPFGGGVRRCLAASYAQQEMKQVIAAVLGEVELRPVDSRSERVAKGGIAFSPGRRGLVLASPRRARGDGRAHSARRRSGGRALAAQATGSVGR